MRSTRPTSDGRFSFTGLPAGTYLAIARTSLVEGQWEAPDFLDSARATAERVVLTPGGSGSVTIRLP